jgi:hypothetical protein
MRKKRAFSLLLTL